MPRVNNHANYEQENEVPLGTVAAGHVVLIRSDVTRHQDMVIVPYIVGKVGNTPINIDDGKKTSLLTNAITGRIINKHPAQRCVVVSGELSLKNYYGEFSYIEHDQID